MTRPKNAEPTLAERLAPHHHALRADDERYRELLAADTINTVEGSRFANDIIAAQRLRNRAKREGDDDVAGQNLTDIADALRRLLRSYGQSREQRERAAAAAAATAAKLAKPGLRVVKAKVED